MNETQRIDRIGRLPILGVCGWSGSGKTTLIEAVLPRLLARNLKVAVVKHDVHAIDVDRPGKDSDRFFQAGADVYLQGNEELNRRHPEAADNLLSQLHAIAGKYDLILVEGHKQSPLPKVWLLHEGENSPPAPVTDVKLVLPRNANRPDEFIALLDGWLSSQWLKTPVYGFIYMTESDRQGGAGQKLSTEEGKRLKQNREMLREYTEDIVVVGNKTLSVYFDDCLQLPRAPDLNGPLAGLMTAMRWHPLVSWLVVGSAADCNKEIWPWFLAQRRPGIWGVLPPSDDSSGLEFQHAYFDFRAAGLLDNLSNEKSFSANLVSHSKMYTPNRSEYHCAS